jgi:uncharacterized protein (DUF58 family)
VSPTPRLAVLIAATALGFLFLPSALPALVILVLLAAGAGDAFAVRRAPTLERTMPGILARGVPAELVVDVEAGGAATRVRQPVPPDLDLDPREADGRLAATLVPRRRGRHPVPAAAVRVEGRFGLGRTHHRGPDASQVLVYPDMPAAHRLVVSVRHGRFRDPGVLTRGPLGLGTDFESIRDYLPDDDIRQVNWRATERLQRPMSNQFRVEQDREVMLLIDSGRLMAAPLGDRTRLDAAVDAAVAVALVADVLGDRAGTLAFDREVRRRLSPRRAGGHAVVRALLDLQPSREEPDYELAFRTVEGSKRSLMLIFCDLLDETAARPLADAVPVLSRRHAVTFATVRDPDLDAVLATPPESAHDVGAQAVALDVLGARTRTAHMLRRSGAQVVEAPAETLSAACVAAYLRAKSLGRA